jgi:lysophospholipase L1-like esterase
LIPPSGPEPAPPPPPPDVKRSFPCLLLLALAYVPVAIVAWTGFATHRSAVGVIGPYTPGYLAFLLALGLALLVPLVTLLVLRGALGERRGGLLLLRGVAAVFLLYGVAEIVHASVREHRFDPFLQFPGARFEATPTTAMPGVTRVTTLGGSTTHGGHLPPEQRYPAVLEDVLSEAAPHEVLNAGMDWWTSKHSHANYVNYLRRWNPEVVVVMHAINDLYRSFSPHGYALGDYDPQWTHFFGPAIRGARPRSLLGRIRTNFAALEFDRRWFANWRFQEEDLPVEAFLSLPDFEFSLRSLVRTLVQDGARVVLVTQPSIYRVDLEEEALARLWFPETFCTTRDGLLRRRQPSVRSMAEAMEAFNAVVARVAQEEGVALADAASRVPRTLEYFGDDVHYTQAGAATLAEVVAEAVLRATQPGTTP